jgi:hypothetical protein
MKGDNANEHTPSKTLMKPKEALTPRTDDGEEDQLDVLLNQVDETLSESMNACKFTQPDEEE